MALEFAKHFFGGKRRASTFQNITNVILLNKIYNNCNLLYNCNFLHTFRIQKTWGFPKTPPIKEIRKISANKYYKQGVLLLIEQAPVCMIRQYELWEIRTILEA